jgi:regulator of cell morphogenesis and NO signaling
LQTQEHKIFPAIKQLIFASRDGYQISMDSIESLVLNMEAEHKYFSAKLKLVVSLLSGTESSKQADSLTCALLEKLTAFERNFNQHIKLEHKVLFPKALRLEKDLRYTPD